MQDSANSFGSPAQHLLSRSKDMCPLGSLCVPLLLRLTFLVLWLVWLCLLSVRRVSAAEFFGPWGFGGRFCSITYFGTVPDVGQSSVTNLDVARQSSATRTSGPLKTPLTPELIQQVPSLTGKRFVCHCALTQSCHADALIRWFLELQPDAFDRNAATQRAPTAAKIGCLRERNQCDSTRWSFLEIFDLCH